MSWTGKIFASRTVIGIEILLRDEEKIFNYSVLRRAKDTVELSESKNNLKEIAQLGNVPQQAPVCVVLNGKGIIHKKINLPENSEDKMLLSRILPAANPEDFFLQKIQATEGNVFVSVVRKNIVNDILEKLKTVLPENEIVYLSLGPFSVLKLLPLLRPNSNDNEIRFANHSITFLPGEVHEYVNEKNDKELNFSLGSATIQDDSLISFAAAYQYYNSQKDYQILNIPLVIQGEKRLNERRNFQLTLGIVLSFFLLVLLVNYFLFDHYWNKKSELTAMFKMNQDAFSKLEKLKTDFSEKQNFLRATGFSESSRLSYYADQIAMDLPESILLGQLNLYPVKTKLNDKEMMSFNNKKITVSGTCRKSTEINEWIKSLKKKSWIEDLVMVNYSFDNGKELADFTIEITTRRAE